MKIITLFIIVLVASGCLSPVCYVRTRLNCQDYSNAWARDANNRGIVAGVVWYSSDTEKGHAICWCIDPETFIVRYIEPQGRRWVDDPSGQKGYEEIHRSIGPTDGKTGNIDWPLLPLEK